MKNFSVFTQVINILYEPSDIIMYNPTVKKGNWLQKLELGKEKVASFLEKREKGELLVQQTRNMFHNLLQKTRLSKDIDGFVKFGSCIQLKAPDMPNSPPPTSGIAIEDDKNGYGVVMTGTIHDKHISKMSSLTNDCNLVASPLLAPCMRNSFVIKSADDCQRDGENLLFGQEFVLQIVNPSGEELYARSEKPSIDGLWGPLGHEPVRLSNKKDCYALWKVLYWDKAMRIESEGAPFPPYTRVVVRHVMSGRNLAVEGTVWWVTLFGNECGLSVHTYLDVARRDTAECLWMFVTQESHESSSSLTR